MLNTKYLLVYKYKIVTENLFQEEKKPKYNKCETVKEFIFAIIHIS